MKICTSIEEGVKNVFEIYNYATDVKWEYRPAGDGELIDKIILDGEEYPLFWWRCDTQIALLTSKAAERKPCSMKLNRSCPKSEGLESLLYREIDIAESVLSSRISRLMCFKNKNALNMLATMENERIAVFELAAALNDETEEQGRHIYWGEDGMASDRVVSQKVASEAIYLFTDDGKDPETYNDIFIYMYGLSKIDIVKAAAIVEILMGRMDVSDWKNRDLHYRDCISAAYRSAEQVCRVDVTWGCE